MSAQARGPSDIIKLNILSSTVSVEWTIYLHSHSTQLFNLQILSSPWFSSDLHSVPSFYFGRKVAAPPPPPDARSPSARLFQAHCVTTRSRPRLTSWQRSGHLTLR